MITGNGYSGAGTEGGAIPESEQQKSEGPKGTAWSVWGGEKTGR